MDVYDIYAEIIFIVKNICQAGDSYVNTEHILFTMQM